MPFLIFGVIIFIWGLNAKGETVKELEPESAAPKKRLFDLPDIDPADAGGNFKKDYNFIYEAAADKYGVPFALLKSHAQIESSENEKAFRDENPQKNPKRIGWASRGLMQTLFWPGSDRFVKYGYTSDDLDDGERLFDPSVNVDVAAQLIRDNLNACKGNVRDAINMYNAGVKESVRQAPLNYVGKVLAKYETIIKRSVV